MNARRAAWGVFLTLLSLVGMTEARQDKSPIKPDQERPPMAAGDVFSGVGEQLRAVTDSQIKVLQRLIDVTGDGDPEKPDLLFRMAELYAEQAHYFDYRAREVGQKVGQALKDKDVATASKLSADRTKYETTRDKWVEAAMKKYADVADGPNFQKYKRMDQVLFYLSYLLLQARKEEQSRVYFKRLLQDFPESPYLPDAHLSLAGYYYDTKDLENAGKYYDKVVAYGPTRVHDYAVYMKGWISYNREDYPTALETFSGLVSKLAEAKKSTNAATLARESKKEVVRCFSRMSKPEGAPEYFRRVGGDYAPTMMKQLAELYDQYGKPEYAETTRKLIADMNSAPGSPNELLAAMDAKARQFKDLSLDVIMTIQEPSGSRVVSYTLQERDGKRLLRFTDPADLRGMGLFIEGPELGYAVLPAFGNKVRRLGAAVWKSGFMGSDLAFSDFVPAGFAGVWNAKDSAGSDNKTAVLELARKGEDAPPVPECKIWIDKSTLQLTRREEFDIEGKKVRTLTYSDYQKDDGGSGHQTARLTVVVDHMRNDHKTEVRVGAAKADQNLPEDLFRKESLTPK